MSTHEIFVHCWRFCLTLCNQITLNMPQNERKNNTNDIIRSHFWLAFMYSSLCSSFAQFLVYDFRYQMKMEMGNRKWIRESVESKMRVRMKKQSRPTVREIRIGQRLNGIDDCMCMCIKTAHTKLTAWSPLSWKTICFYYVWCHLPSVFVFN